VIEKHMRVLELRKQTIKNKRGCEKLKKTAPDVDIKLRDYMCDNFYDIRTFGAVMTTFCESCT
jgi:cas_Csd2: CRISPR-associated protein, Csd2 family